MKNTVKKSEYTAHSSSYTADNLQNIAVTNGYTPVFLLTPSFPGEYTAKKNLITPHYYHLTMARKTVRVDIPARKAEDLMKLIQNVSEKYTQDSSNSPLRALNMTEFVSKANQASEKRKEAKRLADTSQGLNGEAEQLLGIAPGQNRQSEGSLLYQLTLIRDQLLLIYRGNEDKLAEYGFKVSVGTASTPGRKPKIKEI
jgi:hypothetical protein